MYKIVSTATNFTHNGKSYGETNTVLFSGAIADVPAGQFGDFAYCISGTDKGKVYIYDGTAWVEQ